MTESNSQRKQTGLRYGDASKIARRHRVSPQHVLEVARGNRPGRESLVRSIEAFRRRAAEEAKVA